MGTVLLVLLFTAAKVSSEKIILAQIEVTTGYITNITSSGAEYNYYFTWFSNQRINHGVVVNKDGNPHSKRPRMLYVHWC
ncbi:MAG: hypothetical protein C4308_07560 [Chitinophagaceae bacterium]